MNQHFRTISAFMRHTWLIEPTFATAHLPLIESYLTGKLNLQTNDDQTETADDEPATRIGFAVSTLADADAGPQVRYALEDPELPDNSVYVIRITGAIFKESTCCSTGTEELARMTRAAYANPKIIGVVGLVDSPGGQLSGTPTLYDVIRDPIKPFVSVVNEGLMASAAYWLACGSDHIYATQQTDQIGSIGVYVQLTKRTEQEKMMGIETVTIYSDRSTQKNKPYRDALAGDNTAMLTDINTAADLFRAAVEQGRGSRLKPAKKGGPDVFAGGLFYAGQAIALGLIDGYGDLDTAVAKVAELAGKPADTVTDELPETDENDKSIVLDPDDLDEISDPDDDDDTPGTPDKTVTTPAPTTQSPTLNPIEPMFGFTKLPAIAAVKGVAAESITDAQITAINAELAAEGYQLGVVSQSQFAAAQTLQTELATANATIVTQTEEITRLGKQPGTIGTKVEKTEESLATPEGLMISETDAELTRLKGKK